jgi:hypothetical protein
VAPVTAIRNADSPATPTPARGHLAAAGRHADASGISVRALHQLARPPPLMQLVLGHDLPEFSMTSPRCRA